jgi:hypothetical protein
MEFFRIKKDIPFMRHALALNAVSLITFFAAVFFTVLLVTLFFAVFLAEVFLAAFLTGFFVVFFADFLTATVVLLGLRLKSRFKT